MEISTYRYKNDEELLETDIGKKKKKKSQKPKALLFLFFCSYATSYQTKT